MHISILLMEQIIELFIMILMGFIIVKAGIVKDEDSKVLSKIVLYLIINMIVAETATNISVMKVLGFSQKEISNRVLNVNHILVCIGYLIGIPAAYMFVKVGYSDTIENYGMLLSPVLTARTLVIGFVLTWVVYEISLLLQKKKISRIDMVEALKENNRNE